MRRNAHPRIGDPVHHLHQSCSPRCVARNLLSPQAARAAQRSPTAMPRDLPGRPTRESTGDAFRTQSRVWARNALWRRPAMNPTNSRAANGSRRTTAPRYLRHARPGCLAPPSTRTAPHGQAIPVALAVRLSQSGLNRCLRWRPAAQVQTATPPHRYRTPLALWTSVCDSRWASMGLTCGLAKLPKLGWGSTRTPGRPEPPPLGGRSMKSCAE